MASKAKSKKRRRKASPQASQSQIQRNLQQGNYKQALKDARACYRQQPTPEHRRLLEFASMARAQQLQRFGNFDACRGVADSMLELGVSDASVQAALPDLLLWVGMLDRLPKEQLVRLDSAEWAAKVADYSVLHPERGPRSSPEVRAHSELVRRALEAVYDGASTGPDLQLQDIPRHSPFADWKLLVRGLVAYYEQDTERMQRNWSRLDPHRAAARIARPLEVISGARRLDPADSELRSKITRVELGPSSQLLSQRLDLLRRRIGERDITETLRLAAEICPELRQVDTSLERRLIRWLCDHVVREGDPSDVERLARIVDPEPIDPHWNRARALVRDFADDVPWQASLVYWRAYAEDLVRNEQIEPLARRVGSALVWVHIARAYRRSAERLCDCMCGASHDDEIAEAVSEVEQCLEKCFELAPQHVAAYALLAELYNLVDEPDKAADVYRRLLEHLPDNVEALVKLIDWHLTLDDPIPAQQYAARACQVRPLDRQLTARLWETHLAAARCYALEDDFARARSEF